MLAVTLLSLLSIIIINPMRKEVKNIEGKGMTTQKTRNNFKTDAMLLITNLRLTILIACLFTTLWASLAVSKGHQQVWPIIFLKEHIVSWSQGQKGIANWQRRKQKKYNVDIPVNICLINIGVHDIGGSTVQSNCNSLLGYEVTRMKVVNTHLWID